MTLLARNKNTIKLSNLDQLTPKFVDLMHKAQRSIHLATLETINALVERYPDQFKNSAAALQSEILKFIDENDIQRSSLACQCAIKFIKLVPAMPQNQIVLQQGVQLASSQLIHGQPLVVDLQNLFQTGCQQQIVSEQIVNQLINNTSLNSRSAARIAAIIITSNNKSMLSYINNFIQIINSQNQQNTETVVKAILSLGEIGLFQDLSQVGNIIQLISNNFHHIDDQIRQAAAIALGSMSIGNTGFFLDKVFNMIEGAVAHDKYMFLSTLREIIINKPECLKNYIGRLMPLYVQQSNSDDEPIRNIVSESIGKLFVHHYDQMAGPLEQTLNGNQLMSVATCARSFKYSAHNNHNVEQFEKFVSILINLASKNDLEVKKNCLQSLNQIAFNPNLKACIKPRIQDVVLVALNETPIKKELITTVDLGPFKHTVDNGVPNRKAAFSLLETLAEHFNFNQQHLVEAVIQGIADSNEDVQLLCLGLLNKLIGICPIHVIGLVDSICEKFQGIYNKHSSSLKKEDEAERATNLMRGVLRVCESINRNQEACSNINFQQWFTMCVIENGEIPAMKQLYDKVVSSSNQLI